MDEERQERGDTRFQRDPALEPPDWSQGEGEDFWDTSNGRIRGQCRVHVRSRTRLFDPRGAPGALPVGQYTGERVTVVAKGDGQLEAFRDRFDGHEEGPRDLHDSSEWIGWTWFEVNVGGGVDPRWRIPTGEEADLQAGLQGITAVPSLVDEGQPADSPARMLTDRQVYRGARYLFGPALDRGPPEPSVRKRVIQDLATGEVMADDNFEPGRGISTFPVDLIWRELEEEHDLVVYLWYFSADGRSLIDEAVSADRNVSGAVPYHRQLPAAWPDGDAGRTPDYVPRSRSPSPATPQSGGAGQLDDDEDTAQGQPQQLPLASPEQQQQLPLQEQQQQLPPPPPPAPVQAPEVVRRRIRGKQTREPEPDRGELEPDEVVVPANMPVHRIDRKILASLQKECEDFGPYYQWHRPYSSDETRRRKLNGLKKSRPRMFHRVTVDGVIKTADLYQMIDGLLYRKVRTRDGQELRPCAPSGAMREIFGIVKQHPVPFRRELLHHYHSGVLGHHVGREQTIKRLQDDWYWPTLRSDTEVWCQNCVHCRGNYGNPSVSAWTRTTLYNRPFRCLQIDTVKCPKDPDTGIEKILTVICPFSRWCWAIPIEDETGPTIGRALIREVFGPMYCWPAVLRSDNGNAFLSEVVAYVNSALEVKHITGATYHPQSQGSVERMHRSINSLMKGLFEQVTYVCGSRRWVEYLPLVVGHLRAMNMAVLGGRSPMEVVMGIKPRLPQTIAAGLPVRDVGIDTYVRQLVQALTRTWQSVREIGREVAQQREGTAHAGRGEELREGDLVLRVTTSSERPRGKERFHDRYDGEIYRIRKVVGSKTYTIEKLSGEPVRDLQGNDKRISGEEMVKCSLPELDFGLDPHQPRRLELQNVDDHNQWDAATLDGICPDGRVFIRYDNSKRIRTLIDLTKRSYRWLQDGSIPSADPERSAFAPFRDAGGQ